MTSRKKFKAFSPCRWISNCYCCYLRFSTGLCVHFWANSRAITRPFTFFFCDKTEFYWTLTCSSKSKSYKEFKRVNQWIWIWSLLYPCYSYGVVVILTVAYGGALLYLQIWCDHLAWSVHTKLLCVSLGDNLNACPC